MKPQPIDIPSLMRRFGLHPDKRLGQNFLIDESALSKVAEAAGIGAEDAVLEIGPGLGSLTRHLAARAHTVVAVEIDADLISPLQSILSPYPNVIIMQGDILKIDPRRLIDLLGGGNDKEAEVGYLVVANIPYYITSALIRRLLEASTPPRRMVLTVQKEVAERITAEPGEMSLLALSVQVYGQPKIVDRIPAGAFYPPPKVDSAIVRVDIYPSPVIPSPLLPIFFKLAKAGFSQKRKTLRNSLSGGLAMHSAEVETRLSAAGIDPMRRAETLSLEEWRRLAEWFYPPASVQPLA